MIEDEDDILRGGAGQRTDMAELGQIADLPSVPEDWDRPGAEVARTLIVFPSLKHLPRPSAAAIDRGDSPRALAEPWADWPMPLVPAPDPGAFTAALRARFPWASDAIEAYAMDLVGAPFAAFRPRILVGPPGFGKTEFARAVLETAGLDVTVYAAAGQMDGGSFGGTSRQWGSWRPSVPAQGCLRHGKASHGITVDEVEKAGTSRRWGRLDETLLPFLERGSTARAIHDPALECALDLSAVSYVLTANSLSGIVQPLLDRAPPLHWPAPRAEDLPIVAAAILAGLRRDRGLDVTWCPDLDGEELDALTAWRGGSLRPLRRMVETILASRDVLARRMPN
ncbi:AAA family ATPase [Methylobacterium tardum]